MKELLTLLTRLLNGINQPKGIYGDGAYDTKEFDQAILDKESLHKQLGNNGLGFSIWKKLKRYPSVSS